MLALKKFAPVEEPDELLILGTLDLTLNIYI